MTFPATLITAEQIAALELAVAAGTLEVSWESGGVRQKMVYQSMDALLKALAYFRQRMAEAGSAAARPVPSTLAEFVRD